MTATYEIADLALVGDTRSAALIAPDGAVVWWCLPRFDAAPVFGQLVGGDRAGTCLLGPAALPRSVRRSYKGHTATVVTTWELDGAVVTLEDAMVAEVEGHLLPDALLVRHASCRGGEATMRLQVSPRFGYGHERAHRERAVRGTLLHDHGDLVVTVATDAPVTVAGDEPVDWVMRGGDEVTVVVSATHDAPAVLVPPHIARAAVARDERGWSQWCRGLASGVPHREAVIRSLLTLQLLTYSPSGAPVAAPTTSLPEEIGGARNWDYRYAWPRDAAIGVNAFTAAGREDEAKALIAWLLHATRLSRPHMPPLLSLDGRPAPRERELAGWPGYRRSRPVRVGNAAADQHQLDVYGWLLDAAWALTDAHHPLSGEAWRAFSALVDYVAAHWREPDAGIWERRDAPAHHVHSKLMAWTALDRGLRIGATRRVSTRRRERWARERDALATDIRTKGFDEEIGAYTGTYSSTQLDAAVLLLPVLEFEPEGSPRLSGTVDAIRERLSAGGPLLHRYEPGNDALPGGEGAFLPCSFWLVQALARIGRRDEAEQVLVELLALASPLCLYGEEMDPTTRAHLGNFPQAFTHATLVQAVLALARSVQRDTTAGDV